MRARAYSLWRYTGSLWIINPRAWVRIDAKHGTRLSDNHHQDEDPITYIELDRMVKPPLRSAPVSVPAIFELWPF